jgi:uncharacterized protein YecE (DUF72 family)
MSFERYRASFGAMEVQSTFYRLPRKGTAKRWRERFGEDFVFTLKAYQGLTHASDSPTWKRRGAKFPEGDPDRFGGLKPTAENYELWERVLEVASELKSEFIVIQFPPSFLKNTENVGNLAAFLGSVERPVNVGVELRQPAWFEEKEELSKLFSKLGVVDVVDPFKRDPILLEDTCYFRLHGLGKGYRYTYSESELTLLKQKVEKLDVKKCYVFFNNLSMADDAQRFRRIVEEKRSV